MLTKNEALEIVSKRLHHMSTSADPFIVIEKNTIEKPFGWVFFYNSKTFIETGESRYRLAGNGPVIVNKHNGSVEFFGASKPPLEFVAEYEQKLAGGKKS
jgi:Immunity protein 35